MGDPDWRVRDQAAYLRGVLLVRSAWTHPSPHWDHDHCVFCFEKFAEVELIPDALHEGFSTQDRQHWICPACFADFRDEFQWCTE